jgi:uncharacterized protein YutE (UPF0331/DUF86 family)
MVDAARLRSLLDRIGTELRHLRRLAAMSDEALAADPERMPGLKYRLQVAVEAAIDAAEHVIASEGLRAPETFADAFAVLGESGYLDKSLADLLEDAARLRNLLVHGYATVDDARVREILRTRIDDLERFRVAIAQIATGP